MKKIQLKYDSFEKGEINSLSLKTFIKNDLKLKISDKLDYLLESKGIDGKDFTTIIKNLDLMKKENYQGIQAEKEARKYMNTHNKFKRNLSS